MKKNGKLLAALFLFSSVFVSPISTIVNAEETSETVTASSTTESDVTDSETTDSETTNSETTDSEATDSETTEPGLTEPGTTEPGLTEPGTIDPGATEPGTTDPGLTEPGTTDPDAELAAARALLQAKVMEAKNFLDYDKYTTLSLYYLENFILYAESILADPDATLDEVNNAIDMINSAVAAVKSLPRDPKDKIAINATDQTMYVGDVLTPEMVLGWANIANGEDLYLEMEVIGEPIMVNSITDQLVKAGTYTIRYTIKSVDADKNPLTTQSSGIAPQVTVVSKDITLTVLDRDTTDTDPIDSSTVDPTPLATTTPSKPVVAPLALPVNKDTKDLPETGSKENSMMLTAIGFTMVASVYFMKKRKESEFNLY